MFDEFDQAVVNYSKELGISTEKIYKEVEKHKDYKGYRDHHTIQELLKMLEDTKKVIEKKEMKRIKAKMNRVALKEAMDSIGVNKVKGAQGGTYWE